MNASINPKSAAALTVMGPQKNVIMRYWCVLLFAVLVFANLPAAAFAQSSSGSGIQVKILNIRSGAGTAACALFDSPVGFPIEFLCYSTTWLEILTEGYGFSNDAKTMLGPPSFSSAGFPDDVQNMELTVTFTLRY